VQKWDIQLDRVLTMQERLLGFLIWAQGISLAVTMPAFIVAVFLSGIEGNGFKLSDKVLMFLGGVTITSIGSLITTAITTFLKQPKG